MKKKFLCILFTVFTLTLLFCGCAKTVDDHTISFKDMTFTLPDGDWKDESEGDYALEFSGEDMDIKIGISDDGYISSYENRGFEFFDYCEEQGQPEANVTYIDGYIANYDSSLAIIKYSPTKYYYIENSMTGDEDMADEEFIEILQSIEFVTSGDSELIAASWKSSVDIKAELPQGKTIPCAIQGEVANVDVSSDSNKPTYIDIGEAYPDTSRVTALVWEENFDGFYDYDIDIESLEGETVIVWGDFYLYDGVVNVELDSGLQLIEIVNIYAK